MTEREKKRIRKQIRELITELDADKCSFAVGWSVPSHVKKLLFFVDGPPYPSHIICPYCGEVVPTDEPLHDCQGDAA